MLYWPMLSALSRWIDNGKFLMESVGRPRYAAQVGRNIRSRDASGLDNTKESDDVLRSLTDSIPLSRYNKDYKL